MPVLLHISPKRISYIRGNPVNPIAQRDIAAKTPQTAIQLHKDLLNEVFLLMAIPREPPHIPKHLRLIPPHQLRKSLFIAANRLLNLVEFVGVFIW